MNHTERKYYIKTQYGLVEVEQQIYYAFYDGKEEENKQKKKLKYNCNGRRIPSNTANHGL